MVDNKKCLPKLIKDKNLVFQKLGGQVVIFDSRSSRLFTFNKTAGLMLEKIRAGWDREKVIDFMTEEYRQDQQVIERDLDDLLKELKRLKLAK